MSGRRWLTLGLAGLLSFVPACGPEDDAPSFDPFAKASAPTLPRAFHGEDLDHWLKMVESDDVALRAEAVWALGELGVDPAAHVPLFARLLMDDEARVREAALHTLVQVGTVPSGVSWCVLLRVHYGDELALDLVEGGFVAEPDIGFMLGHSDPMVRLAALDWMWGRDGDWSAHAARVSEMARGDPDGDVLLAAFGVIGALDPASASVLAHEVVGLLLDPVQREAAIERLSLIGAAARPALEAFLASTDAKADRLATQVTKMLLLRLQKDD